MKKKIATISMTLIVGGLLYFTGINDSKAYYYGPPAGYTGSPYDGQTCDVSGCHDSYALQSAQPWISSNIPVAGYSPDSIYTITAKAVRTGCTSFGFEISPQTTNGSPLGKMILTNSTTTQIVTSGSLQYMEQTIDGYRGTDSLAWTFQWKAPASGSGSVTFYGAFNCGNGNTTAAGAHIFPATLSIPENLTTAINNIENEGVSLSIFPNPAKEKINITYTLKEASTIEIDLFGTDGRKISNLLNNTSAVEGEHSQVLSLPLGIQPGIYLVQLITNGQSAIQKVIID